MNKRPGQINVTVESGFCSFCDRTRNLRREERQLGALIRTVTSCESCHRVLSSTIGVAEPDAATETTPAAPKPAAAKVEASASTALTKGDATPKAKAAAKPKAAPKPKAPATRSRPGK
ncbi:MAG: hypothetical protein QOI23_574 [Chloroflexota bacterium]|nr:hypothetical protein [Chloroflexota bacterium]